MNRTEKIWLQKATRRESGTLIPEGAEMVAKHLASRVLLCACACMIWRTMRASALTFADYEKYSDGQKALYVTAAVSMLMFNYAAAKDTKARCVNEWYFRGTVIDGRNVPPTGPTEMIREIGRVGRADRTYHIEGIVLDRIGRVCGGGGPSK